MEDKQELNYKAAYLHLFNEFTNINDMLEKVQRYIKKQQCKAEELCIDESKAEEDIDTTEILTNLINEIKANFGE